jgi:hypothetical protein
MTTNLNCQNNYFINTKKIIIIVSFGIIFKIIFIFSMLKQGANTIFMLYFLIK